MQLLGDGYEIPEMTKLHGLLPPSRFAQRSASGVDRCVALDSRFVVRIARDPAELLYWRSGGWPAAASVLGHRWSVADTSVGVVKVNAQIATQADPHCGMQAGPR